MRKCERCGEQVEIHASACAACGALYAQRPCVNHADRDAVVQCVICETPLCEACDQSSSRAALCEAHASIPMIQGWAQVYTTASEIEAQLLRDNLVAEGIDARVFSQHDHAFAVQLGDLSPVRVLVPAWEYATAREIIVEHEGADGALRFEDADQASAERRGDEP
ncbi:MAG: DUF2007 domain-containing protein [Longimicrobiales bacterium]